MRRGGAFASQPRPRGSGFKTTRVHIRATVAREDNALKLARSPRSPVALERFSKVVVFTDSTAVHNGFSAAEFSWSRNSWMRRSGPSVLHADLWKEVMAAIPRIGMPVRIEWIPGKSSRHAMRVDALAKDSARRPFGAARDDSVGASKANVEVR